MNFFIAVMSSPFRESRPRGQQHPTGTKKLGETAKLKRVVPDESIVQEVKNIASACLTVVQHRDWRGLALQGSAPVLNLKHETPTQPPGNY